MHYYQFNIADFALHTSHLSVEEEGVYRRLLDYYYDTESPIPTETQPVIRRLRLVSHAEIVASILSEFFVLQSDGWHNLRADSEIEQYREKGNTARENGKKGGRPKKNKSLQDTKPTDNPLGFSGLQNKTQPKANQELRTNNHKPITNSKSARFSKPTLQDVAEYVATRTIKINPQRFIDHYESNGWKVGKNPMKDWKAAVRTWEGNQHGKNNGSTLADPNERGISGAERTRRAREQARLRELAR